MNKQANKQIINQTNKQGNRLMQLDLNKQENSVMQNKETIKQGNKATNE